MKRAFLILLTVIINASSYAQTRDLAYYISEGLNNSPLLKDYHNQELSAKIDSQRIRAIYKPQVTGTSADFYAPVINGYGYDPIVTNNGAYNALVNVDQAIAGRKNIHAQLESTLLQRDSISNIRRVSEQDMKRAITAQYITTYGDLQQLDFYEKINELLNGEDTLLKKLTQSNVYKQADYLIFMVTMQQQMLQLRQLRIQFQTNLATLNYLCGIYDTSTASLSQPVLVLSDPPDMLHSIFFMQYMTDSLRLQNNISILNYSYHPKVTAFVNGGFYSSFIYQAYKNFGTSAGLNVTVPIFDGHQRQLQYNKIRLLEDTRTHYRDFFTRQYNQQIAMLRQQLNGTESLIAEINSEVRYSEALISADQQLMKTGDARITDFIIAVNSYLTSKNLLTQNNISRMQIINQINYWNR